MLHPSFFGGNNIIIKIGWSKYLQEIALVHYTHFFKNFCMKSFQKLNFLECTLQTIVGLLDPQKWGGEGNL